MLGESQREYENDDRCVIFGEVQLPNLLAYLRKNERAMAAGNKMEEKERARRVEIYRQQYETYGKITPIS